MDVLYPYCAGIDVHKKTVSVCVLTPGTQAKPHQQVREFGTTTRELLELADWLLQNQVIPSCDQTMTNSICNEILYNQPHERHLSFFECDLV